MTENTKCNTNTDMEVGDKIECAVGDLAILHVDTKWNIGDAYYLLKIVRVTEKEAFCKFLENILIRTPINPLGYTYASKEKIYDIFELANGENTDLGLYINRKVNTRRFSRYSNNDKNRLIVLDEDAILE